ncbi:MAG TPA: hypothetical protein VHZ54_17205 [Solirubrobacterales bacterium]|jgi:hypothetical protein|nr:hypothetical protein [Solirubrobacterales bacterium]
MVLRVAARLLDELPGTGPVKVAGADSSFDHVAAMTKALGADDDALVREIRAALATIAARLGAAENQPSYSVQGALDAAEIVMRGELTTGRRDQLSRLMPSLVFLIALPIVEQDRALALSQRTAVLIAEEAGD